MFDIYDEIFVCFWCVLFGLRGQLEASEKARKLLEGCAEEVKRLAVELQEQEVRGCMDLLCYNTLIFFLYRSVMIALWLVMIVSLIA